jgi:hypothetical protein
MPVAQITAMPNATNKEGQSPTRNRDNPDLPCGLEIIETPELLFTPNRRNRQNLTLHSEKFISERSALAP